MIKVKVDWHQKCHCCGTELVVDFLNQCPVDCSCPWCGTAITIETDESKCKAREKLIEVAQKLEDEMNLQMDGHLV